MKIESNKSSGIACKRRRITYLPIRYSSFPEFRNRDKIVLTPTTLPILIAPMRMPDEADVVGADVYPWPRPPVANLDVHMRMPDEADVVGADVYPWPRPPVANLDVQICTIEDWQSMTNGDCSYPLSGGIGAAPIKTKDLTLNVGTLPIITPPLADIHSLG